MSFYVLTNMIVSMLLQVYNKHNKLLNVDSFLEIMPSIKNLVYYKNCLNFHRIYGNDDIFGLLQHILIFIN